MRKINRLFASLVSVRIVKNCDLRLENAARRQDFQDLSHSFSLYGPPSQQITYIYSLCVMNFHERLLLVTWKFLVSFVYPCFEAYLLKLEIWGTINP